MQGMACKAWHASFEFPPRHQLINFEIELQDMAEIKPFCLHDFLLSIVQEQAVMLVLVQTFPS